MTKLDLTEHANLPIEGLPTIRRAVDRLDARKVRRALHGVWFVGGLLVATLAWSFRAGQIVAAEQSLRVAMEQTVHDVNDPRAGLLSKQPRDEMGRYVTREEFAHAMAEVDRKLDRVLDYLIERGRRER